MCSREMDPIRYTRYAEECFHAIADTVEYPTDAYLVQLVNLHRMSDKIARTLSIENLTSSTGFSTPIGALVKSLQGELLQLKDSLPHDSPFTCKSSTSLF